MNAIEPIVVTHPLSTLSSEQLDERATEALEQVVRAAHAANLPVLVDAAAQLPPAQNLHRFIDAGADLVVFSGGKGIGGPSASGVLCGRRRLVASALLQQLDHSFGGAIEESP